MSIEGLGGILPELVEVLRTAPGLVLTAPAGAGKTTMVPRALYDAGFAEQGEILILEPRRLAARLAARWVASGFGEKPGSTVGYSIRFEDVSGPLTRIRFLTEGILSRRIVRDPLLDGASVVILDEFHERHVTTDLALALIRRLQAGGRPDIKVVVMSATLDPQPVARFLDVPVLTGGGSPFETSMEYEVRPESLPLQMKVAAAVSRLLREGLDGDVLVFLPGAAEIRLAAEALEPAASTAGIEVLPLHGDLPAAAQARAVEPSRRRKIILSTNVAETSVTIPGIAAVIDSGLARVAGHSPWSGFPTLTLSKISRNSAAQRAGRAGRTRAGRVLRLYTRHDYQTRPERDVPEIHRADLAEPLLVLHGAGVRSVRAFGWFEPPQETALEAAEGLLAQLGALDAGGRLSSTGARMLDFPAHPRLARLIVEGGRLEAAGECALLAALLSERDIRLESRAGLSRRSRPKAAESVGPSDMQELIERFEEARRVRFDEDRLSALAIDARAVAAVERTRRQFMRRSGRQTSLRQRSEESEESVRIAVLAAFPDRVARRRSPGSSEFLLAGGGSARLSPGSVVQKAGLLVAVDAEERKGKKGALDSSGILIRLASAIEPEWLAALFPDEISEKSELAWNAAAARVEDHRCTLYRQLVLEENVRTPPPSAEASRLLADAVAARGLSVFPDAGRVPALQARIALLARKLPACGFTELNETETASAAARACSHKRSFAELAHVSFIDVLLETLRPEQRALLEREAPERITLPGGRRVRVHYERGRDPWIASRLQDFFGMKSTPSICSGKVPLIVHLLAPNMRPVQVTRDLAGFWERHYPKLRRQLQRRYPKHSWPDA